MPLFNLRCRVFDPIRFSPSAEARHFIVDTWHEHGLITGDFHAHLPGVPVAGTGDVMMSGNMKMRRPFVHLGIQINNVRVVSLPFFIVDAGMAPVLFGADFLPLLLEISPSSSTSGGPGDPPRATLEAPDKRASDAIGIRLLPETDTIEARELERFISVVRRVHNVAALTELKLHQHDDWPFGGRDAKRLAVTNTVEADESLSTEMRLSVRWVESGSVWVTLGSGIKSGLSWLTQIFKLSIDARLEATIAGAASAREKAVIEQMTRDDVVRARRHEERLKAAKAASEARSEWRKTVLEEIDFRKALNKRIADPVVREEAQKQLDSAIQDLAEVRLFPLVEHLPVLPPDRDHLPTLDQKFPDREDPDRGGPDYSR